MKPCSTRSTAPDAVFHTRLRRSLDGLWRFRDSYPGQLILQMMFVQANKDAAPQMADLARSLAADQVQLNTPLQPALGHPVSAAEMQTIQDAFAGLPVCCVYDDAGQPRIRPRFL